MKAKVYANMDRIFDLEYLEYKHPVWGCLRLQWVSLPLGAWKYARTRGHYRIVASPYMHRAWHNTLRPGEKVLAETPQCTGDYAGGVWGFEGSAESIAADWNRIMKAPVKVLKSVFKY